MTFELPALPYDFQALEPVIDARTVEIHYTKHHATYLKNLNTALEKYPQFFEKPLESLITSLDLVPEDVRTAVRNNGGGVYNHDLYWKSMSPNAGGKPIGTLGVQIDKTFGDFEAFKTAFEKAGLTRFGSGYAWLSARADATLVLHSTANQDSPVQENLKPLLVVDVWEHAYYLNYQNRRADYLSHWWEVVDWQGAEKRYLAIK
jgi:superoxide dismutase, Fe-Mn family